MQSFKFIEDEAEIKLMETNIATDLSVRAFNLLTRGQLLNIYSIIIFGEKNLKCMRNMGKRCIEEIKNKLYLYGVDLEDEEQCNKQIERYLALKSCEYKDLCKLMEKSCESLGIEANTKFNVFKTLSENNYENIYDILKENNKTLKSLLSSKDIVKNTGNHAYFTQYGLLVIELMKYGINLEDREACNKMVKDYERIKEQKENDNEDIELAALIQGNDELQSTLDTKMDLYIRTQAELLRRKQLVENLAKCDERLAELFAEYTELTNNEEKKYEK